MSSEGKKRRIALDERYECLEQTVSGGKWRGVTDHHREKTTVEDIKTVENIKAEINTVSIYYLNLDHIYYHIRKEGNRVMKISFSPPDMTELEAQGASEAIKSGWITTGPKTKEFERQIAEYCHVNKAVCLNSQTACAEMALRLLGIGEQNGGSASDEVITV